MKYTYPDGRFNFKTNTIEDGDTLTSIAEECNTRYGTNYTADDLKNLNSDTISDKNKIYAGNHLNLGKAEDVQKRAATYIGIVSSKIPDEHVTYNPYPDMQRNEGIKNGVIDCLVGIAGMYGGYQITTKSLGFAAGMGYAVALESWITFNYGLSEIGYAITSKKCLPGSHNLIIEQASSGIAVTEFDQMRKK